MAVSWVSFFLLCAAVVFSSPITNPLRSDEDINQVLPEYFDSKRTKSFHTFTPNASITAQEVTSSINSIALSEFKLRWSTTVGSPVYSSPVIFPSGVEGKKQIYVNTFYQYAELLDSDGYKAWGWPLSFEDSSFQGSPMLYDVDGDGNLDMGLVDKNGNMFWVRIGEFGEYLEDYHIQVPKLRVKRDWSQGLDPAFVDSYVKLSMFDRQQGQRGVEGRSGAAGKARLDDLQTMKSEPAPMGAAGSSSGSGSQERRRLSEEGDGGEGGGDTTPDFGEGDGMDDFIRSEAERMEGGFEHMYGGGSAEEGEASGEAPASVEDVLAADKGEAGDAAETAEAEEGASPDGTYEYAYRAAPGRAHGGHRTGYGAGAAYYGGGLGGGINETEYVMVDAHVLASPVLVDINGDGHMEVLVSVSYYFDKAEYSGRSAQQLGFDPDMYVAGGVACWDLDEQRWTWLVHLDLTTAKSKFQAMVYAPPTVADLDGDGRKEVIVGTSMGLLYVMDGESGFVRRFFPMQFHSIQAQVSVADVAGSRDLEMIVLDMGGTVAVVDLNGDIVWDSQLSGTLPFPATVGDVDGDGQVDVVVVAATEGKGSHVYALRGDTGALLRGYPIALPGQAAVSAPVLLVDLQASTFKKSWSDVPGNGSATATGSKDPAGVKLRKGAPASTLGTLDDPFLAETLADAAPPKQKTKTNTGLHLVITSFEGSVYIVRGTPLDVVSFSSIPMLNSVMEKKLGGAPGSGKFHAQRIDVGEHIYCVPLLDDVTGDGFLDLVVGTLNGQVLLYESTVPYHPTNTWPSFPKHRLNSVTHGQMGVSVPYEEKQKLALLDIKGSKNVNIVFEIWDSKFKGPEHGAVYAVSITKGTNRLNPVWSHTFDKPGKYVAVVPVTPPELALFVVSMQSEHGEYFEDAVHVALSTRFYIWLKYLIVTPLVLICFTLCSKFRKHIAA